MSMKENEIQVLGHDSKNGWRHLWPWFLAFVVVALIVGILIGRFAIRESQIVNLRPLGESTIDSALQSTVDSLLREKMTEIVAQSGQAIVMEVETGEIRAMVGLQKRFDGEFEPCQNFGHQQEPGSLMRGVSMLAVLEDGEGINLGTEVETGNGIFYYDGSVVKDHNWHRGGYGKLTMEEVLMFGSNVGVCRLVDEVYGNNPQRYFDRLAQMSFGESDSLYDLPCLKPMAFTAPRDSCWTKSKLAWHSFGYERRVAPLQVLTFYNAIANNGRMMEPMLHRRDALVINPQIAHEESIQQIQEAMYHSVSEGLGHKAETEIVKVAGLTGTSQVSQGKSEDGVDYNDNGYCLSFCGYFPAEQPCYSIIVSMNKIGLPASGGGMAGPVFRQIVEYICEREIALQNITSAR